MRLSRSNQILIVVFAVVWSMLAAWTLSRSTQTFYEGDAKAYHEAAVSIAEQGRYWFMDRPYTEREPGQSIWLAGIYTVLGTSLLAVFFAQGLLYLASVLTFAAHIKRIFSERVSVIFSAVMLLFPTALHTVFSLNRECLALSLFLFLTSLLLSLSQKGKAWKAVLAGAVLGYVILVFMPLLLFPGVVLLSFPVLKISWKYIIPLFLTAAIVIGAWGYRNYTIEGRMCLTGCYRSAVAWAVRGEQARDIHGLMPLKCLYAEYISRDWEGLSNSCSFNGIMHRLWPDDGLQMDDTDLQKGEAGIALIRANFLNYLWFSVFEVLEFHLPYVNGWGRGYNIAAVIGTILLYIGVLLSLPQLRRITRVQLFLLLSIGYAVGLFALTDATPRYFLPWLFCYVVFSAIGYDRLLTSWSRSRAS